MDMLNIAKINAAKIFLIPVFSCVTLLFPMHVEVTDTLQSSIHCDYINFGNSYALSIKHDL